MRILQLITRSEIGGAQAMVAGLCSQLIKKGHDVAIASGGEGCGEAWKGLDPRIELFEVGGLGRSVSMLADIEAWASIRRLYRQWKPDIVHLHTSKAAALGRLADGMDVRRMVYTMHGYGQLKLEHKLFLPIDRILARRTGAVVAVSEADQKAMLADGYRPQCIKNGVPDASLASPGNEDVLRTLRALRSSGRAIAMLIAREAPPKRIDIARSAAAILGGRVAVVWLGGGKKRNDPSSFYALGQVARASSYLRFADMLVLPTDHEGLPMAVIEGFSAGIPAILSAVDGCLDVLGLSGEGESDRGIAVANSGKAFAEAIDRLAGDPALARSMGSAGRSAWERSYSLERMENDYLALYSSLASR